MTNNRRSTAADKKLREARFFLGKLDSASISGEPESRDS